MHLFFSIKNGMEVENTIIKVVLRVEATLANIF